MALHTRAPFLLVRAAAPYFRVKDGESRSITNVSSTSGIHGNAGQANYATAKMGLVGFTKTIAKEWGPAFGVRANAVAFGSVATRLTQPKEAGAFAEVAGEKIALGIPSAQMKSADGYLSVPLRRAGTPTEAAMSILMLASPLSSYVSGHCLEVSFSGVCGVAEVSLTGYVPGYGWYGHLNGGTRWWCMRLPFLYPSMNTHYAMSNLFRAVEEPTIADVRDCILKKRKETGCPPPVSVLYTPQERHDAA
jgi:hypothetical protein